MNKFKKGEVNIQIEELGEKFGVNVTKIEFKYEWDKYDYYVSSIVVDFKYGFNKERGFVILFKNVSFLSKILIEKEFKKELMEFVDMRKETNKELGKKIDKWLLKIEKLLKEDENE